MSSFDEREQGYEAKFRLDQEFVFKVEARAAHLIGLWAARRMGLAGAAAEAYANATRDAQLTREGKAEVLRKLGSDLKAAGIAAERDEIAVELDRMSAKARQELMAELASGAQRPAAGV